MLKFDIHNSSPLFLVESCCHVTKLLKLYQIIFFITKHQVHTSYNDVLDKGVRTHTNHSLWRKPGHSSTVPRFIMFTDKDTTDQFTVTPSNQYNQTITKLIKYRISPCYWIYYTEQWTGLLYYVTCWCHHTLQVFPPSSHRITLDTSWMLARSE